MTAKPRPLVAGNWKMNGLRASLAEIVEVATTYDASLREQVELLVCPPATLLCAAAAACVGTHIGIGAQDCHPDPSGPHTGDISAEMLADCGAAYVIVGHSERRADHGEDDALVCRKVIAAHRAGVTPIVCVGETEAHRRAGEALDFIGAQIAGSLPDDSRGPLVVAYEPVWAIGSGLTPSLDDVAEVHGMIRDRLVARYGADGEGVRILYGGSVKPSNAAELMAVRNVDGALVGGASLVAAEFLNIARVYLDANVAKVSLKAVL